MHENNESKDIDCLMKSIIYAKHKFVKKIEYKGSEIIKNRLF